MKKRQSRFQKKFHNVYGCFVPKNSGIFFTHLLGILFHRIPMTRDQLDVIRQLPTDAIIIYATKNKNTFERMFFFWKYGQLQGIPCPEIFLDDQALWIQPLSRLVRIVASAISFLVRHIRLRNPWQDGFMETQLYQHAGFLSLVEPRDFYKQFVKAKTDPLLYLIRMQQQTRRPIYIVPHVFLYDKRPPAQSPGFIDLLFGSIDRPGSLRKMFISLKNPDRILVETSEPVSLQQYIAEFEQQGVSETRMAWMLRRQLIAQINRHSQSITGPVLKSSIELKQHILTNPELRKFMEKHAKRREITIYEAHREALKYFDEIAAKYNPNITAIGMKIGSWIFHRMFDDVVINRDGLNQVRKMARKGPLVLVPCHRSHIDSIILHYIQFHNNLPCPHVFAGINLAFWPMGSILRRVGAFFVRRNFSGAVFYSKVFSAYIQTLIREGFHIEVFIEGTRSRTGKFMPPQLGMINILVDALRKSGRQELIFVPVFIGYDRVPEEQSYLEEITGGEKTPENLQQMIQARQALKRRHGRIYIRFETPLPLSEILADHDMSLATLTSKQQTTISRYIGYRLVNAIDQATVITPQALIAGAILNIRREIIPYDQIVTYFETVLNYLDTRNAILAESIIENPINAVNHVLAYYSQRNWIKPVLKKADRHSPGQYYQVPQNQRQHLEYYKNTCISPLIPAVFTALLILDKDAFQFSTTDLHQPYQFLRQLFANEFISNVDIPTAYELRKAIKSFIDEAVLIPHPTLPDTYNITSPGFRTLRIFAGYLLTFLEAYWIVLSFIRTYEKPIKNPKDRKKKIHSLALKFYKQGKIHGKEAISHAYFENAFQFFTRNGVKGPNDSDKISWYETRLTRLIQRIHH